MSMQGKPWMRFRNMKLLHKLMLIYTVVILVPTTVYGFYTYTHTQRSIRAEIINSNQQTLLQVKENLEAKIGNVHVISKSIAYNGKMQNFLMRDFRLIPYTLEHYKQQMIPLVSYAMNYQAANIHKINIYMSNASIPEVWKVFYWEHRLAGQVWYEEFLQGDEEIIWRYPSEADHFHTFTHRDTTRVVTWIHKIQLSNGRHLGSVAVDILEREFFKSIRAATTPDRSFFLINDENEIIYAPEGVDVEKEQKALEAVRLEGGGFEFIAETLYLSERVEAMGVNIISKVPAGRTIENAQAASLNLLLGIYITAFSLILISCFILRLLINKFNQIIEIMDHVASGKFDLRIPVGGDDEIGRIARGFNLLIEKINTLVRELIEKEGAQRDAQLTALQYQINPHFIYNTIDLFPMRMELDGNYETAEAVTDFGKMLRYNLRSPSRFASLEEELNHTERFLNLQRFRLGDRVSYSIKIVPDLEQEKVIRFLLQPIVENSIMHGYKLKHKGIHITIDVYTEDEDILIVICDNGAGIPADKVEQINFAFKNTLLDEECSCGESIGLTNINHRIQLFYGRQYFVQLYSRAGEFTQTIVRLPRLQKGRWKDV